MRCTYVKIIDSNRIDVGDGDTLEKYFDEHITIVKGGNGSGKSSLFNELTPLPADRKDYGDDGYKEIHYEHKGRNYELISDFTGSSPKYTFIVDGESLNKANLLTAQKGLVFTHFGINQIIHDILVAKENFTRLSVGTRKKLIAMLSRVNIDHVLRSFDDLNSQCNLNKLMLKTEMQQYKIEENKLLDAKDKETLQAALLLVKDELSVVVDTRNYLTRYHSLDVNKDSMNDLNSYIESYNELIRENFNYVTMYTPENITEYIKKYEAKDVELRTKIQNNYKRLEDIKDIRYSLGETGSSDAGSLSHQHETAVKRVEELTASLSMVSLDQDRNELQRQYFKIYEACNERLEDLLDNLDTDGNYIYTRAGLEELYMAIRTMSERKAELGGTIISIRHDKMNMDSIGGHINCPKCQVSISLKEIFTHDKERNQVLEEAVSEVNQLTKDIEELNEERSKIENYFKEFKFFMSLKQDTEELHSKFWQEVVDGNLLVASPKSVMYVLTKLTLDMDKLNEIYQLKDEIKNIGEKLQLLKDLGTVDFASLAAEELDLNSNCTWLGYKRKEVHSDLCAVHYASHIYKQLALIETSIERHKNAVRTHNLTTVIDHVNQALDDRITELKLEEVNLTKRIHENEVIENTLKVLQEKIDEIEDNVFIMELAINELSPKNGLIAKTISSFLNTIIENMNITIERIWSYPLVLLPIDVEQGSLNYKFKVKAKDKKPVDDVELLSDGQQEGMNLSFRLLMYVLLGLHDYPLFFDELARSLDIAHTESMMKMVRTLINDSSFSQIFIINHKENTGFIQKADEILLG